MRGFSVTFERYLPHDDDEDVCEPDDIGVVVHDVTLRDAMRLGLEYTRPDWAGQCEADCYPPRGARWLTFPAWNEGTREEIEQGISEARSLHIPDSVTDASRGRIVRLFQAYGWERS
jgi:hypothetical protein